MQDHLEAVVMGIEVSGLLASYSWRRRNVLGKFMSSRNIAVRTGATKLSIVVMTA